MFARVEEIHIYIVCVSYIYSVCVYIHISSPAFGVGGEDCDTGGLYENVVQE